MTADLDTLLIALYVELTDQIIPSLGFTRSGPGHGLPFTDRVIVTLVHLRLQLPHGVKTEFLHFSNRRSALFPQAASYAGSLNRDPVPRSGSCDTNSHPYRTLPRPGRSRRRCRPRR